MSGIWSIVALVAWIVLPGSATAAVVCRTTSPVSPVRVLTIAIASGLSVWFLGSELLARLDLMTTTGAVVGTAVVGVASLVVALGPGRAGLRVLRSEPVLVELVVMLVATVVVAFPLLLLVAGRMDTLNGTTPWYYLDLARSVAHVHGVPATSPEWATHLPFLDDYPAFTSGTALLLAVGGTKSMVAAQAVRIVTLVAVGRGGVPVRGAPSARPGRPRRCPWSCCSPAPRTSARWPRTVPRRRATRSVFIVGALAKLWLDERRNLDLVLATIGLLALSEVHGIGWLFDALVVGGLAVGSVLFSPERRVALRAGVLLVGVLVAGWLVGNLVLGSGLSGANKLGGLPPSDGADPTWKFVNLVSGHLVSRPAPSAAEAAGRGIIRGFIGLGAWWYFAVAVVAVVLLLVVAWRGRGVIRQAAREYSVMALLVVAGCVGGLGVVRVAMVDVRADPHGWGRVVPLTFALLPAGIALGDLRGAAPAMACGRGDRRARARRRRHGARALVLRPARPPATDPRDARGSPHARALRDDLVLTNAYSEGFVTALGGRGVLDGRAPYSEPHALEHANRLLTRSVAFFADPAKNPLPSGVKGIDYVLVATTPNVLGTPLLFPTAYPAFDQAPGLRLVRTGPGYRLYAVATLVLTAAQRPGTPSPGPPRPGPTRCRGSRGPARSRSSARRSSGPGRRARAPSGIPPGVR